MTLAMARIIMRLAAIGMRQGRPEWALAMSIEFEVAVAAGAPLRFALGCLTATLRDMSTHEQGRFTLTSYAIALGLIVPMGTLLSWGVILGFPFLMGSGVGLGDMLGNGLPTFPMTQANRSAWPLLAILTFALGVGHLPLAWAMLERDWVRVAALGRVGAAMVATMLAFTAILFLYDSCAIPQAAAVTC